MRNSLTILSSFLVIAFVGCSENNQHAHDHSQDHAHGGGMMEKPAPAPEMKKLQRMVGNWTGTAEFVDPPTPEMAGQTFAGGGTTDWVMDGHFLKSEGWHEMGPGQRMNMVEYITWDDKANKYRSYWFSDWGEVGEGTMTMSADGNMMTVASDGFGPDGKRKSASGTMKFVNNNTMEWTWTEKGPEGTMKLKGTSKRKM